MEWFSFVADLYFFQYTAFAKVEVEIVKDLCSVVSRCGRGLQKRFLHCEPTTKFFYVFNIGGYPPDQTTHRRTRHQALQQATSFCTVAAYTVKRKLLHTRQ
jgi:hypothetical protein